MGDVIQMKITKGKTGNGRKVVKMFSSKDTGASLRVNAAVRNRLKAHAIVTGMSLYELSNKILTDFLKTAPKIKV